MNTLQSSNAAPGAPGPVASVRRLGVLGTPLVLTTYVNLVDQCHRLAREPGCTALEFTNTQIVVLRRHQAAYRALTRGYDWFIPDATPLVWCLNRQGARLPDRVYGPTFMRACLQRTTSDFSHYLLGGSPAVGAKLRETFQRLNPAARFVGGYHGNCSLEGVLEGAAEVEVVREINRLSPDFIWLGLGTPKQDAWLERHKAMLARGVVLSVGFAFDVNAGTKPDAPAWMQQWGLTWLFRLASEPRRLAGRYLKYNSLFLLYLVLDGLRGNAWAMECSSPGISRVV